MLNPNTHNRLVVGSNPTEPTSGASILLNSLLNFFHFLPPYFTNGYPAVDQPTMPS